MGKPKTTAAPAAKQAVSAPKAADVVATAAIEPAPPPVTGPTPANSPSASGAEESQSVEPLEDFLRRVEAAHLDRDVVATAATHPEATERVWPGTYGGIRLSLGPVSVTYSDGTQV